MSFPTLSSSCSNQSVVVGYTRNAAAISISMSIEIQFLIVYVLGALSIQMEEKDVVASSGIWMESFIN